MAQQPRESAKKYIEDMYINHREDDLIAWNNLIDIIFDYIDETLHLSGKGGDK